jgi:hypothetical protein
MTLVPRAKSCKNKQGSNPRPKKAAGSRKASPDISWIKPLAAPYLRDYQASGVTRGPLRGYRFLAPGKGGTEEIAGFFVGYLLETDAHEFLAPVTPEAIVFAYLGPVGSAFHQEIVAQEGSLLRKTAEYIGWLTHRPPPFAFFDNREVVLARHVSMAAWPRNKQKHFSRNFFIETLAWLVRSGLVAKLRGQSRD